MAKKTTDKKRSSKARRASARPAESEPQQQPESTQEPQAGADAPAAEESGQEPAPEQRIAALEQEKAQLKEQLLRAHADFDNYRKRMQRDLQELRAAIRAETIQEFLGVLDHFEMAMAHAEQQPDLETLKQGMDMILAEFQRVFQNLGVERIEAVRQEFDPEQHEAVAQEPSAEVPAGKVLRQWKCGYRLGNRLLRPASVVVSSGPDNSQENAD